MSLAELNARLRAEGALVAGVLSGTSADGIDVGLARLRVDPRTGDVARPELVLFATEPFEPELGARVRHVLDGGATGLREAAFLHRDLGRAFGRAAHDVAARARLALDLVGSHGQTVWHHDGAEAQGAATLQLGDGDHVAAEAGAITVSDFRAADVAAGGEGAPLSALADDAIFAHVERPCAILNLGGMANLTILGPRDSDLRAFDTGPANSLLDGLARVLLGAPCDQDGAAARRGRVDPRLVAEFSRHPFFDRAPPKSTGRDTFGRAHASQFVEAHARHAGRGTSPDDVLATATACVAASVALALERFVDPAPRRLLLAGGGAHNQALVAALARSVPCAVEPSSAAGVDPDAREALVFAVLAARLVLGRPTTHPGATGARPGMRLGKISFGGCRGPRRG